MRKVMMLLMALGMGGCLCLSGCMGTLRTGEVTLKMESLPKGIWAVDFTVSSFESVTHLDVVKGIEMAVDGVKSLAVGMVPLG